MDELINQDSQEQRKPRSPHVSFPELGKLILTPSNDREPISSIPSERISSETEPKKPPLFRSLINLLTGRSEQPMRESRDSSGISEPPSSKEYRRICSEIVPNQIYISGWLVAEDWDELSSNSITHVINTASSVSKCPFPEKIYYLPLSIEDSKSEDIQSYFYICIDFIESAISSGGRVLVHCMEGVSRSCSIVIAYLMWKRSWSYKESQSFVQEARPICQPNTGFICQILEFQKILENSNPASSYRNWRLQAKELTNGAFIVIPSVLSGSVDVDPRFVYLRRFQSTFEVLIPSEESQSSRITEIVDIVCSQISRIERIAHTQIAIVPEFEDCSRTQDSRLDDSHALFIKFLAQLSPGEIRIFGQCTPIASGHSSDVQYTSRSHRSHGSIDSARHDTEVLVFQIDIACTKILENPIPYFDSDDLDSRAIYLFLVPSSEGDPTVVIWVGNEVDEIDDDQIINHVKFLVPSAHEIHIVQQGSETDAFWNLFEQ